MPPTPPITLVTGANTGIGRVTARELARAGYRVFLAYRSPARTRPVLEEIATVAPGLPAEWLATDLADRDSVRACARDFLARGLPLHLLVNNAGLAAVGGTTVQGFEMAFGTNHLGHFLLTKPLLPQLCDSAPARVVTVASRAHERAAGLDWDALVLRPPSCLGRARQRAWPWRSTRQEGTSGLVGRSPCGGGGCTDLVQTDADVKRVLPHRARDHVGNAKIKEDAAHHSCSLSLADQSHGLVLVSRRLAQQDDVVLVLADRQGRNGTCHGPEFPIAIARGYASGLLWIELEDDGLRRAISDRCTTNRRQGHQCDGQMDHSHFNFLCGVWVRPVDVDRGAIISAPAARRRQRMPRSSTTPANTAKPTQWLSRKALKQEHRKFKRPLQADRHRSKPDSAA